MIKCAKCGKVSKQVSMVLMSGWNGFRRYPVCKVCDDQGAPPPTPLQIEKRNLERGEVKGG